MNEYDEIVAKQGEGTNEYDALINADQPRQRLRASMVVAQKQNPDQYGEAKRIERQTGLPAPVGARNLEEVKLKANLNEYDALLNSSPVLARHLQSADFASLSHDDIQNLSQTEFIFGAERNGRYAGGYITRQMPIPGVDPNLQGPFVRRGSVTAAEGPEPTVGSVTSGILKSFPIGWAKAKLGLQQQMADLFGHKDVSGDISRQRRQLDFEEFLSTPNFSSSTAEGLYSGGTSTIQQIPGIGLSLLMRNPWPALATIGTQVEGESYGKYRARGGKPGESFVGAVGEGATEIITERIPMGFLVSRLGKAGAGQFLAGLFAREVPTEQIATLVQDAIDTAIANPDKTWGQYIAERPDAAYKTLLATLVQSGVMGTAHVGLQKLAGGQAAVEHAQATADALNSLSELAKASKVRERDPQSFAEFVDAAAAEGGDVQNVYVDARTFAQAAGESLPELVAASPAIAAQIEEAVARGGDIIIPIGEYASTIAPHDANKVLMPHLRTDPEGMSMEEAKTFMQSQAEEFKQEATKVLEQKEFDTAFQQSAATVEKELLTQLKTANRFTDDVNANYAKLAASFYTVQAARLGITPEEMYVRYPLQIQAEGVKRDNVMDQGEEVKKLNEQLAEAKAEQQANPQDATLRARVQALEERIVKAQQQAVANAKGSGYSADNTGRGQDGRTENDLDFTGAPGQPKELHTALGGGAAKRGWAEATRIRRADGQPSTVYRGARRPLSAQDFEQGALGVNTGNPSSGLGVWFTISSTEAKRWGEVEDFHLDIRNPLVLRVEDLPGFESLEAATVWREEQRAKGHDGILVSAKHVGGKVHLVAFEPSQVIYPARPAATLEQADKNALIVQHNMTAENLLHALRMGGIPVPSLAISKANDSITHYGEITLVGPKEMANPRGYARTKVFGGDIYSPRYPDISYKADKATLKKLNDLLAPYRKEGERETYGDEVNDIRSPAFERWAQDKGYTYDNSSTVDNKRAVAALMREIGAPERIFTGFDYNGNRRYKAHTLENVIRMLKKELRGGESAGNIYGIGQLRSKFAPQFRTIQSIQRERDRIVTDEQFEAVKKEVEEEFFALAEALQPYYSHSVDPFRFSDTVMALIEDAARIGLSKAAREYGFNELPEDVRNQVWEFTTRLRNMPTEYFEAKILRGVGIEEFTAAVVPEGTKPEVIDALQKRGVKVETYKKGDDADRKRVVAETAAGQGSNVLFQETIDNATGKPEAQPPFYSVLQRQIEAAKMNVAPAAQWKSFINSLSSKGVKKDEITMSGVLDWLDTARNVAPENLIAANLGQGQWSVSGVPSASGTHTVVVRANDAEGAKQAIIGVQPNRVTKEQVLNFLSENGVRVEEKILGEPKGTEVSTQVEEEEDEEVDEGPSDEEIEEKAIELWREQLDEEARNYARESDYAQYDVVLRVPNVRVVQLPADMLREKEEWGIQEITYNLSDNPNHEKTETYWYADKVGVSDLDELGEPRFVQWLQEPGTHGGAFSGRSPMRFASEDEAQAHIDNNDGLYYAGDPYFTAQFYEQESDIGGYNSKVEAERAAEEGQESVIQQEAESFAENASVDDHGDYFYNLARELLEEERNGTANHPRGWRRADTGVPSTRHPGRWQSEGGRGYRELVLSVPNIEPYNAGDSTHFQTDTGGRTVAWARFKIHDDENGTPTLFLEEIQSQRAQHGREQGFKTDQGKIVAEVQKDVDARQQRVDERVRELGFNSLVEYRAAHPDGPFPDLELRVRIGELQDRQSDLRGLQRGENLVPTAPFVQDTQAWTALVLKRVMRYAADHGIKQIAWTTGTEQVVRYGNWLREQIDTIEWKKVEGGVEIKAKQRGNTKVDRKFDPGELRSALGASIAGQIINSSEQSGEIKAADLTIDDLGMANYYGDERGLNPKGKPAIVPIVADKIAKSLGSKEGVKTLPLAVREAGQTFGAAGVEITPEMANKTQGGQPLFQSSRGQIAFADDIKSRPSVLTLLQNADLSTFLHEMGHFQLEVLADIAAQENAPPEIGEDMRKLLGWFKPGMTLDEWRAMPLEAKRPYHEQFARGFESYLFEGKSPAPELNSIFARFRAWLINVYKQLTALNVQLTDEVRGVMNRMVATNDQILAAEAERNYEPLFKSAEQAGMTPEEWKAYHDLSLNATQEAISNLQSRSLRDMQWLTNARSRMLSRLQKNANQKRREIEREVTAEVRETPVYAAQRFLRYGELPEADRSNAERRVLDSIAGSPEKLSLPALKKMYGDGPAAPWRYMPTGKSGLVATDGIHPDIVAELFGFSSGDELVRKILDAQPESAVIEGMTDQRMLERYGDLSDPQAIERAANEAIHNEARVKFVATELRALAKATGQKNVLVKAAREFAETIVARKKLREIKPAQYAANEARASKAAERALVGGNTAEAAVEKRNQLVNHFATKSAYDAQDYIERNVRYLRRVGDSQTVDPEYREQIDSLLDRFDLRQTTRKEAQRRQSLTEWIASEKEKGNEPVIDPALENEANKKPYQDMTLEEFRGLVDAVRNIEHLGRLKHKLLTARDEREFKARVDEAVASIEANAKKSIPAKLERNSWTDKMKEGATEFFVMHRKFAAMIREMDGYSDGGVLWELFSRPMNYAGAREAVMREQATIRLTALFKAVEGLDMKEKMFIPAINNSLSREGRIMVMLNAGNAGNLQRMMDGDHWSPAQVRAIIDTLTKPEADFVQAVWDLIGEYRPQIGEQQRRLTGLEPEWVEPSPVPTPHGVYRGGYIPVKYDTTRSTRALSDEAAASLMDQWKGARGRPVTRDSFTKERANKVVDRPVRKDLGVITQHITEVTHRLAWQEFLTDATKLLRAKALDAAIREHYGHEVLQAMRNTLDDIAAGEVPAQNAFERGVNWLRTGATIAGLGWRVTTSLLQPIGLTQSMVRIGPQWVARGIVDFLGDTARMENAAQKIYDKSEFMRLRGKTMQREVSEIMNLVENRNSAIKASYFYLIQKMQLVADIPTWLGQYHKAVESGADEDTAIAQADQAVLDAQGGGQLKDLAAIQRGGPLLKLFTNFYSFFNTTYQLTGEAIGRTDFKNPLSIGRLAVDMLLLYSVPAALGTLLKFALGGGEDGEDKLWRKLIADQLTYLFGTVVGLREVTGGIQTAAGLPGDYQGPASVRLFAELAKLGKQAGQGEIDEALLKAANSVGGILFHYPAGQINATADGIYSLANGKTENPGALLVGSNKK